MSSLSRKMIVLTSVMIWVFSDKSPFLLRKCSLSHRDGVPLRKTVHSFPRGHGASSAGALSEAVFICSLFIVLLFCRMRPNRASHPGDGAQEIRCQFVRPFRTTLANLKIALCGFCHFASFGVHLNLAVVHSFGIGTTPVQLVLGERGLRVNFSRICGTSNNKF